MGDPAVTREFERKVVLHCAPVLAGIKPASMFSCPLKSPTCCGNPRCRSLKALDLYFAFTTCAEKLSESGVRLAVLTQRSSSVLVFVYREAELMRTISADEASEYLESLGYETGDLGKCLARLSQRISLPGAVAKAESPRSFPHEVGVFLGYPVEDVIGFIENRGDNYLVCGCWKAYSHAGDARACFCRYKQCTAELTRRFQEGARIEEIAAPGIRRAA